MSELVFAALLALAHLVAEVGHVIRLLPKTATWPLS